VPKVKQRLGIGNALADASASEILELLRGGSLVELDNGWRLTLSHVAGDDVVELVLCGVIANKDELRGYGFFDETIYYKRRWFTHVEDAPVTLERLLSRRRPVRDMTAAAAAHAAAMGSVLGWQQVRRKKLGRALDLRLSER